MKKNIPSIQLPSISPKDRTLKTILQQCGFVADEALLVEVRRFLHAADFTNQMFKYTHHEINEPIIKEHNKKVRDLKKYTSENLQNIKAITIHTRKGAITFCNDRLSGHLIKKLFGEDRPSMHISGDFDAQVKYLTSTKLVMPMREYPMPDKDQLFISIVEDAVTLGRFMYKKYTNKKVGIQRLIMALLNEYFPSIEISPASEKKTFQNHFNKVLG